MDKIIEGTNTLLLIKGEFEGRQGWCYFMVNLAKYHEFTDNCRNAIEMELGDYGEIVLMGNGESPSEEEHSSILKKYDSADGMLEKIETIILSSL